MVVELLDKSYLVDMRSLLDMFISVTPMSSRHPVNNLGIGTALESHSYIQVTDPPFYSAL